MAYYCARSDVEDTYGKANVTKWATLQGDATADDVTQRIDRAMEWATSEVNSLLRGGPYTIPFVAPIDPTILYVTAMLAGCWLHDSRSIEDVEADEGSLVLRFDKMARRTLSEIMAGKRRIEAAKVSTNVGAPMFVRKQP